MSEDCWHQPPVGLMTEPLEKWRCPCSDDPVYGLGDVGVDLIYLCEADCGWSWAP